MTARFLKDKAGLKLADMKANTANDQRIDVDHRSLQMRGWYMFTTARFMGANGKESPPTGVFILDTVVGPEIGALVDIADVNAGVKQLPLYTKIGERKSITALNIYWHSGKAGVPATPYGFSTPLLIRPGDLMRFNLSGGSGARLPDESGYVTLYNVRLSASKNAKTGWTLNWGARAIAAALLPQVERGISLSREEAFARGVPYEQQSFREVLDGVEAPPPVVLTKLDAEWPVHFKYPPLKHVLRLSDNRDIRGRLGEDGRAFGLRYALPDEEELLDKKTRAGVMCATTEAPLKIYDWIAEQNGGGKNCRYSARFSLMVIECSNYETSAPLKRAKIVQPMLWGEAVGIALPFPLPPYANALVNNPNKAYPRVPSYIVFAPDELSIINDETNIMIRSSGSDEHQNTAGTFEGIRYRIVDWLRKYGIRVSAKLVEHRYITLKFDPASMFKTSEKDKCLTMDKWKSALYKVSKVPGTPSLELLHRIPDFEIHDGWIPMDFSSIQQITAAVQNDQYDFFAVLVAPQVPKDELPQFEPDTETMRGGIAQALRDEKNGDAFVLKDIDRKKKEAAAEGTRKSELDLWMNEESMEEGRQWRLTRWQLYAIPKAVKASNPATFLQPSYDPRRVPEPMPDVQGKGTVRKHEDEEGEDGEEAKAEGTAEPEKKRPKKEEEDVDAMDFSD
jgi:hypothetical protein